MNLREMISADGLIKRCLKGMKRKNDNFIKIENLIFKKNSRF